MGLVRRGATVIGLVLLASVARPQSQLTGAEVKMVYSQGRGQFQVTERLQFDTIQVGQVIRCKALNSSNRFPKENVKKVVHSGIGEMESFVDSETFQSFQVKFDDAQGNGWIEVQYVIDKSEGLTEVPLFFTEYAADSSEEDFFTFELEFPEKQNVHFHFPTADYSLTPANEGKQLLSFAIPALPSVIRLELAAEPSKAFVQMMLIDLSVALIFVAIGFLIFKYRNALTYG